MNGDSTMAIRACPPGGDIGRAASQTRISSDDEVRALSWLDHAASERLASGLHRELRPRRAGASDAISVASNDYLGLSKDSRVLSGARSALTTWGAGSTASRLVTGTTDLHQELEKQLARFCGFESALVFSSGYLANIGAIGALVGRGDLIVSDAGAHASLIDGCRLSRARVEVVGRGDVRAVERALATRPEERAMVVTDSVYSIDGALAPVAGLYEVARAHRAVLLVDEAHALGVHGTGGRGLLDELHLSGAPDLVATTVLSKSLGSQGGAVLGSRSVTDQIVDRARTFIFDTGLAPTSVGAALAALMVLKESPELSERVRQNAVELARRCNAARPHSAVVSLVIGDPAAALAAAEWCHTRGVVVGCFRPPSVPWGTSRLRLCARADLSDADLDRVAVTVNAAVDIAQSAGPAMQPVE